MWRTFAALLVASGVTGATLIGASQCAAADSQTAIRSSRTIVVTLADNGHSYRLQKNNLLDVQLSGSSGFIWTEPASSDAAVLKRTSGSSGAAATATFTALAKGRVQVMATGSPNCSGGACPALSLAFRVTVSVVG